MWHDFELSDEFFSLLLEIDRRIAEEVRAGGCGCGGRLHRADYPRKPRGIALGIERAYGRRFSFCCDQDGCRERYTPMSVRFLGRRVYVAAVVVLACVRAQLLPMAETSEPERQRPATKTAAPLAPRRAVMRWHKWWQTGFVVSTLYAANRGRVVPPVCTEQLPFSLLSRFSGTAGDKLKSTLKYLSPLSTSRYRSGLLMVE
jgi:hypothetical protein